MLIVSSSVELPPSMMITPEMHDNAPYVIVRKQTHSGVPPNKKQTSPRPYHAGCCIILMLFPVRIGHRQTGFRCGPISVHPRHSRLINLASSASWRFVSLPRPLSPSPQKRTQASVSPSLHPSVPPIPGLAGRGLPRIKGAHQVSAGRFGGARRSR